MKIVLMRSSSMVDINKVNEFVQQVFSAMPDGLKNLPGDVQKNLRSAVQTAFAKMDLVTREEFDAQRGVLARTREKLEALENKVAELEK
jgi:ubiquinone biosynthesis accessory factor UbiK